MTPTDISQLPVFLRSYDDLSSHIRETLDDLDNTAKGRAFAQFASRVIPLELGDRFTKVELGVEGPDGGVDLISTSADNRFILYGQAKLTIKKAEEIELIISKFHDYYHRVHTEKVGQRYMEVIDKLPKNPQAEKRSRSKPTKKSGAVVIETNDDIPVECVFAIVTLSKIEGRVLTEYEKSSYTGRKYYDELKEAGRLVVLDGSKIFPLAQSAYRKSNILPSNVTLELIGSYIHQDNVYIAVVSAKEIKRCYEEYGEALFLDNIRLFLGYSNKSDRDNVNVSIRNTAENSPREMLARNNGITFRADRVTPIDGKLYLERVSIVNGCQTTKCIVDAADDTAYLLVKIVESVEAWSIAKTANSQTKVDQIVLELAKYIRPQSVKRVAIKVGYVVKDLHESIYDVFNSVYRDDLVYDEVFYLFLGLFSNELRNVISKNYTEVRKELLNQLQKRDPDGEQTLSLLFRLFALADEAKKGTAENSIKNEYGKMYKQFWEEDKPDYRSIVTLLAACGCVRMNIYKSDNDPHTIDTFLDKLDDVLTNEKEKYKLYHAYAYKAIVIYLSNKRDKESIVDRQRAMYNDMKGASFETLYNNIRMVADDIKT